VLLLHHPRKGRVLDGQAGRGSGALGAFADVLVEMRPYAAPSSDDRRRVLNSYARHEETPRQLVIALKDDGTDYAAHGDVQQEQIRENWARVRAVLEDATRKLTRRQLRAAWPADDPKPADITLWRWLDRAVGQGLVRRDGSGRSHGAFRYWLPGKEEAWQQDPVYQQEELCRLPPDLPPLPGLPPG
jgi:hypothetical protein